jgi:hypothetical protein
VIRSKQPTYSKYLRLVHVGALLWCPTLISLVVVAEFSQLETGVELFAAGLMVAASVLLDAKDTLNWLLKVQDEFAEKPPLPLALGGLSSLASLVCAVILLVGVWQSL